jgi:hypothetical protein
MRAGRAAGPSDLQLVRALGWFEDIVLIGKSGGIREGRFDFFDPLRGRWRFASIVEPDVADDCAAFRQKICVTDAAIIFYDD